MYSLGKTDCLIVLNMISQYIQRLLLIFLKVHGKSML
jgi:hypothetical protein